MFGHRRLGLSAIAIGALLSALAVAPVGAGAPSRAPGASAAGDGLPPVKCKAKRRYRGKTSQGYKICFNVSKSGRTVKGAQFKYDAECDSGGGHAWRRIYGTAPVSSRGRFKLDDGDAVVKGKITGKRAHGSLRVQTSAFSQDCDTGRVGWHAKRR